MKHSIRQRVLDPVTGLMVTKSQSVNGELGSDFLDRNGKEFFEGDVFQFSNGSKYAIRFVKGSFVASNAWGFYDLATLKLSEAEIVGHADD